jgi:hypothetical protein
MSTREGLTQEELDAQDGEQLPEREAMSIVDLGPDVGFTATPVPVDSVDENEEFYPVEKPPHEPQPPAS